MAITSATLSTINEALKEVYLQPFQSQLNNEIMVMQILKIDSKNIREDDIEGLQGVFGLHTQRSGGIGSRDELDDLPGAGAQKYKRAVYLLKYHYGRAQVSGQAAHYSRSNRGSFVQAWTDELGRLRDDLALEFARQVYGAGDGRVEQCGASGPSTTVLMNSDEALQKGFLYIGMRIDIGSATDPDTIAAGREITDTDVVAKTIVVDGAAVTVTTAAYVYRAGNVHPTTGAIKEMDVGLQKLVSTAANTIGGINGAAAGTKFWQNQVDSTGGAISLDALLLNSNKVMASGAKPGQLVVVTSPGIVRRLFGTADFKTNVRFVNTKTFGGGFQSINFNSGYGELEMATDRLAPYGKVFFLHKPHVRLFQPADWDFLARDGLNVRWVSEKDAFQSILFKYANMGTNRRNTSLVMSGITDTGF